MSNVPDTGSFFIRVVDCGNHGRSGGGRDGCDDRDGHGGRRGGCRIHRIYRPCGACLGRGQHHRHDCPRNRQRGGLQSNGGQDVRQWLNNVHTPGQVVFSYLFGPSRQGNLVWHAPRNNHTIHLATMQIQLQLQSQQLMQQQLSLQMQLQQNLLMQQRVLEQQQQRPARPVLQLQNGATQEGHQQDHQQDHQEDQIDDNVDFA